MPAQFRIMCVGPALRATVELLLLTGVRCANLGLFASMLWHGCARYARGLFLFEEPASGTDGLSRPHGLCALAHKLCLGHRGADGRVEQGTG